jgi:hypothetical protein
MTLESALQCDVEDRRRRNEQSSGGAIDPQPQSELPGGFSQSRTEGSMSVKRRLGDVGGQFCQHDVPPRIFPGEIESGLDPFPVAHRVFFSLCKNPPASAATERHEPWR